MARISGINLPLEKRIVIALTYVYGVGPKRAADICQAAGVAESVRTKDLTPAQEDALRAEVAKFVTEGDLRRQVQANMKFLQDIHSYRGDRHRKGLPSRGQGTKNNARTRRGKRKTGGSGRTKVTKK